jgi:hypothetical protein
LFIFILVIPLLNSAVIILIFFYNPSPYFEQLRPTLLCKSLPPANLGHKLINRIHNFGER